MTLTVTRFSGILALGVSFAFSGYAVASAAASGGSPVVAPTPWQYHVRDPRNNPNDAQEILEEHNAKRLADGLPPLAVDPQLNSVAVAYAGEMIRRNFFGHFTPEGKSPFQRFDDFHVHYSYAAENIAFDESAHAAAEALLRSPEHCENIMGDHYTKVGIAAVPTPDGELVVEDFSD